MSSAENACDVHTPVDIGPTLQHAVPSARLALNAAVAISASNSSSLILTNGFKNLAFGITSSQTGNASIQRYLDAAGTIPQGPPISVALTAATPTVVNANDGAAFQSAVVSVSNSSTTVAATLTGVLLLLQAD